MKAGPSALNTEMQRLIDEALAKAREREGEEEEEEEVEEQGEHVALSSEDEEASQDSVVQAISQNFKAISVFARGLEQSVDEEIDRHQSKKPNDNIEDWERYSAFLNTMKEGFHELNELTSVSDVEMSAPEKISDLFYKLNGIVKEFLDKNTGIKPAAFMTIFGGLMIHYGMTPWIVTGAVASLFGGPELVKRIGSLGKQKNDNSDE